MKSRAASAVLLLMVRSLLALSVPMPARAEEDRDISADVDGSWRIDEWSRSRSLDRRADIATSALWGTGKIEFGGTGVLAGRGWFGIQSRPDPGNERKGRLQELYWLQRLGEWDLRIGRQQIIWGRADAINPTDNLSPRDFILKTPEDSDQRFGNVAVNTVYHRGRLALQTVWMPESQSDVVPLPPLPNVAIRRPHATRKDSFALKLDESGEHVDWSISYLDGYDLVPDLAVATVTRDEVLLQLTNHRLRVLGADGAATVGPYALRAEAAWMESAGQWPSYKRSRAWMVLGGDRSFGDTLNLNLQYFIQRVVGFRSPDEIADPIARELAWLQLSLANQDVREMRGVTLRVATSWAKDTWKAEASSIHIWQNSSSILRGRLQYAPGDRWRFYFGTDWYRGGRHSLFGLLEDNSTTYLEARLLLGK
jgi:hypothetical protein